MSAFYTTNPSSVPENTTFDLIWTDNTSPTPYTFLSSVSYTLQLRGVIARTVSGNNTSTITFSNITGRSAGTYSVIVRGPTATVYSVTATNSPLTVTCFVEGTEILCVNQNGEEEYIKVEELIEGIYVKTYIHGPKKIVNILKKTYKNDKSYSQICKLSDYEGQTKDLYLTGGHSLLVDELSEIEYEKSKEYGYNNLKIDDKKLLLCCVNEKSEKIEDNNSYNVYHFVLENDNYKGQYGVYANGILVESMA